LHCCPENRSALSELVSCFEPNALRGMHHLGGSGNWGLSALEDGEKHLPSLRQLTLSKGSGHKKYLATVTTNYNGKINSINFVIWISGIELIHRFFTISLEKLLLQFGCFLPNVGDGKSPGFSPELTRQLPDGESMAFLVDGLPFNHSGRHVEPASYC
jgi:hypothetical protein